ncbi:MAG TPA: ABC transporter ATP-binding protein [Longimicrobium sp.]|jgi:ABC-2 type transport system ATP-binding protein|uniref:ABC transporter ATP-binding protein n=1 Tax=Longimicrobium sp. TaxID=2029185 RepID=UPI002EDAF8C1
MNTPPVIATRGLAKRYGSFAAVTDMNLSVPSGTISGFLGPNGAGKSTTIRMLLGMVRPSGGTATVLGFRVDDPRESLEIRRRVGYAGEDKRLYDYMTAAQIIRFTRSFFPGWRLDLERRLLSDFRLPLDRRIKKFSKGMRTQLALLLAICRGGELLILDEPTEGLDPIMAERLLEVLVGLAADGTAIFFSSHQIAEVEQIAEHVFIIDGGRLLVDGSLESMREEYRRVDLVFDTAVPDDIRTGLAVPGVERVSVSGRTARLFVSRNVDHVVHRSRALHATAVDVLPIGLKDIFLESLKTARRTDALV